MWALKDLYTKVWMFLVFMYRTLSHLKGCEMV